MNIALLSVAISVREGPSSPLLESCESQRVDARRAVGEVTILAFPVQEQLGPDINGGSWVGSGSVCDVM